MVMIMLTVIFDFISGVDVETVLAINAVAVFMVWLKFFYLLRIFTETASFIRMITEIIKDMGVFSLIYITANLAFANAFFLLDGGFSNVVPDDDKISGSTWWEVVLYVYMTGLGEFGTDDFPEATNQAMFWIFFLLCTILVQLVFLNLLIAIMGDTFGRVLEIKEEASLREKCSLIAENWFYLN